MCAGVAPRSPQTEEEDKRECNGDIVIDLRQGHIEACGVPVNVAWKLSCRTSISDIILSHSIPVYLSIVGKERSDAQ